jgi:hypothetical protein
MTTATARSQSRFVFKTTSPWPGDIRFLVESRLTDGTVAYKARSPRRTAQRQVLGST